MPNLPLMPESTIANPKSLNQYCSHRLHLFGASYHLKLIISNGYMLFRNGTLTNSKIHCITVVCTTQNWVQTRHFGKRLLNLGKLHTLKNTWHIVLSTITSTKDKNDPYRTGVALKELVGDNSCSSTP